MQDIYTRKEVAELVLKIYKNISANPDANEERTEKVINELGYDLEWERTRPYTLYLTEKE